MRPLSVSDYAVQAATRLPATVWAMLEEGSERATGVHDNLSAWARWRIWPRPLRDMAAGTTATMLLGQPFRHPVLLGPLGHQRRYHLDAELATARAADALEAGLVLSSVSSAPLEAVSAELAGRKWFQLYWQGSRKATSALMARARAAGFEAIVFTVDVPVHGVRAQSAGLPPLSEPRLGDASVGAAHSAIQTVGPDQSVVFQGYLRTAPTWEDACWCLAEAHLPVLLKGLMHSADVRRAADAGFAGVVLSNHGGRGLDHAPATADVIVAARAAVPAHFPLLVDGGIRSGTDIFKALALGANAVLIGRPQAYALAVNGAMGVAHLLRLLRDELEIAMALAGCTTLADIGPDCLLPGGRDAAHR